ARDTISGGFWLVIGKAIMLYLLRHSGADPSGGEDPKRNPANRIAYCRHLTLPDLICFELRLCVTHITSNRRRSSYHATRRFIAARIFGRQETDWEGCTAPGIITATREGFHDASPAAISTSSPGLAVSSHTAASSSRL